MRHDARRVRMHVPTGDLVCFNAQHGPTTLTPRERADMLARGGLTPELVLGRQPRLALALAALRQRLSELVRPVRCLP